MFETQSGAGERDGDRAGAALSGWIKFDKDMSADPRLMRSANTLLDSFILARRTGGGGEDLSHGDALRFMCNALRGALVTLWCYADEHIRDDDTLPCDAESLDAIVGIDGFSESMPDEWVTVRDDGSVYLPSYCDKNSLIAKRKKSDRGADRQRRYRERVKASHVRDVTRNETRDNGVTIGGDQDLDQDRIKKRRKEAERDDALPPFDPSTVIGLDPEAWKLWIEHRSAIKKPIRPHALADSAEELAKLGARQLAEVKRARAGGWQGIHPEDSRPLRIQAADPPRRAKEFGT